MVSEGVVCSVDIAAADSMDPVHIGPEDAVADSADPGGVSKVPLRLGQTPRPWLRLLLRKPFSLR